VSGATPVLRLEDLIGNPAAANDVPAEAIPALRGELAKLDSLLFLRLLSSAQREAQPLPQGDRLLKVEEAAAILSKTPDDIYRHDYAFKVKDGDRSVKCSWQLLQEYIRQLKRMRGRV
jgi:hypothetical protein